MLRALFLGVIVTLTPVASGDIVISEWMYAGSAGANTGEFVELTNTGPNAVDMTGWSLDDSSRTPGSVSLSAFGVIAPGQSVILTDESALTFAAAWELTGVVIIGGSAADLGRNDEINVYNSGGTLVDRLTYGDSAYPGTPRAIRRSCNIPASGYGSATPQAGWTLAVACDAFGSMVSWRGDVGSPGHVAIYGWSDFDRDTDVDAVDLDAFSDCMAGPLVSYVSPPPGCPLSPGLSGLLAADWDADGDVDVSDFVQMQLCASGTGAPADPFCGLEVEPTPITEITLNGNSIAVDGGGVVVSGTKATIAAAGTYRATGTLTNGRIVVDTQDDGLVELILNGVNITNASTAPLYVKDAEHVALVLAANTANVLTDPASYVFEDPNNPEPNAALFSDDPLTIFGPGSLTVHGNYNDAISSDDELMIAGGTISVTAVDDGIRGKDYLIVDQGNITISCTGDAIKADNTVDATLGNVLIEDGTFNVTCGGDAVAAEKKAIIGAGTFTFLAGGGHNVTIPSTSSAKGIKGLVSVTVDGGTFNMDCADDGLHSNYDIVINGGSFTIATNSSTTASYGDGIHADRSLKIYGGSINVTTCYEGIESADITVSGGSVRVNSTDDGVNASGGAGTNNFIRIYGGYIAVYAAGDGVDANGSIVMTGGTLIVHGPTANNNAALDYDTTFNISGGLLIAAGSAGMAKAPSTTSTQRSVKITYASNKAAGVLAHIETSATHAEVMTFAPSKLYRSLVYSSPLLTAGGSFLLFSGGSSTGTLTDGLYTGGVYTPGTQTNTFTTTSSVTNVSAP